jgi:hypothetical protein
MSLRLKSKEILNGNCIITIFQFQKKIKIILVVWVVIVEFRV